MAIELEFTVQPVLIISDFNYYEGFLVVLRNILNNFFLKNMQNIC